MSLDFEPGGRTRSGQRYKIFGEIPQPTSSPFVIIGAVETYEGKWEHATWTTAGEWSMYSHTSAYDLVPKRDDLKHLWWNVYGDEIYRRMHSHESRDLADAKVKLKVPRLFLIHEIRCGDEVSYEIVMDDRNESTQKER